jgi:hypothetical protein
MVPKNSNPSKGPTNFQPTKLEPMTSEKAFQLLSKFDILTNFNHKQVQAKATF